MYKHVVRHAFSVLKIDTIKVILTFVWPQHLHARWKRSDDEAYWKALQSWAMQLLLRCLGEMLEEYNPSTNCHPKKT